ncbi:SPOR domain-containing protein [Erythrobacter litoralis]|uniref:SPOR domain-containing protein n=1 Tax=Erythrobacter litoralis TaxID=39960 RepID=UPI0002EAFBCA|nr:SPOR domain-containing protein [Erythrobacter litoralis]
MASTETSARAAFGPEADYPQVLGEPFTVDGELFTPEDVFSYDSVGFATLDSEGGQGVSVAHKTQPYPSYVEVTSLETGKTILARVERRGPMTASRIVALSPGAQAQLGAGEGTPVRVRRVNPPEYERAELRAGKPVPPRLSTPDSLLAVLKEKLPIKGSASLAGPAIPAAAQAAAIQQASVAPSSASRAAELAPVAAAAPASVEKDFDKAFTEKPVTTVAARSHNGKYPLPPMAAGAGPAVRAPTVAASPMSRSAAPVVVASTPETRSFSLPGQQSATPNTEPVSRSPVRRAAPVAIAATADGKFIVQAAAFSSKTNADRAADKLDGFVMPAGRFFRVRTGPYATRGQAEAALAKVRAAGYSDARVFSAG